MQKRNRMRSGTAPRAKKLRGDACKIQKTGVNYLVTIQGEQLCPFLNTSAKNAERALKRSSQAPLQPLHARRAVKKKKSQKNFPGSLPPSNRKAVPLRPSAPPLKAADAVADTPDADIITEAGMKKNELTSLLAALGLEPSRKLGQNFLVDENFLDWIVKEAGAAKGEKIVEVGPGFGALTRRMLDLGAEVTAVEFDHRICEWLRSVLVPKGLRLVEGDACKVDFSKLYGDGVPFRLVSNLPYSAGTVVVAKLLDVETPPEEMIIMLQKEVALRLAAKAGDEEYGALSVRAQTAYEVTPLRMVPPQLFHPKPEVDSCVLRMKRRPDMPSREFRLLVSQVVRLGFSQRRKKMIKQLASVFGRETVEAAYAKVGLPEDIRAERVSVEQFQQLADFFRKG